MIYPLFHALKREFQYFTCIRNGQKKAWHVPLFPDGVEPKNFAGGSVAPNAKCYQLLRAIGRKKCYLNIPNTHVYILFIHCLNTVVIITFKYIIFYIFEHINVFV